MQAGIAREHDAHHKIAVFKWHLAPNSLQQNLLLREDNYKEKHIIAPAWGGKWGKQGRNEAIATLQEEARMLLKHRNRANIGNTSWQRKNPFQWILWSLNWTNLEHHFFANVSSSSRGNHDKNEENLGMLENAKPQRKWNEII